MSFLSVMKQIGHDIKKGLDFILPWAATAGEAAVATFIPALSPLFNSTVAAVGLAEQKYVSLGQEKAGSKKLADVLSLMEPVISQGLKDAGLDGSTSSVVNYINSVVTILNTVPATTGTVWPPVTPTQQQYNSNTTTVK